MAQKRQQVDFEAFYRAQYGDRWPLLRQALEEERQPVALTEGLDKTYWLDEASIKAAKALGVLPGDRVLDMCAAPGGKTLVLAAALDGEGSLVANDRSQARRGRLKRVVDEHLDERRRSIIRITGHDASKWSLYEQNAYDKILLDAPCSSERHVIVDDKALSQWSASRPKRLATLQFAMLAAALEAVVVGGSILYSTCSINSGENEEVIEKLARRREGRFIEEPLSIEGAERRAWGSIILPDRANGIGPLYLCLIRRSA
ncbi:MAG: RsmB/NOP family class I SAM-dependent RNA methyltransferase [Sphaerochaeta sp.]|jgi:16S rRNA C967 or C1407 C5-methylase (RsmB/RsmF family)